MSTDDTTNSTGARFSTNSSTAAITLETARERTKEAILNAYRSGDRVLIEALMTMGKSHGAVAAAAESGIPITIFTNRGNEEHYEQFKKWCSDHGLHAKVLPSFTRDCETANGTHGKEIRETVSKWYSRGATGNDIHEKAGRELGHPLPCGGAADARCSYKAGWEFEPDKYDVLIGHYSHASVKEVTKGRVVVFDEFPDEAFMTEFETQQLKHATTCYLKSNEHLGYDGFTDLLTNRHDRRPNRARVGPPRRVKAAMDIAQYDKDRVPEQAFREGHALGPAATYTILSGPGRNNDLGNGWERASLPDGGIGVFNADDLCLSLLQPPNLQEARGVVALDGTPVPEMWELALGTSLNHRQVLTDAERIEYVRETLGCNIVRTSEWSRPYNTENHVNPKDDAALLDAIADKHERAPALLTTLTAVRAHENAGLYKTDGDGKLTDGKGRVDDLAYYGNLKGSNQFASTRLGAVIGSNHFGDGFIQKWGAFAGEAVKRVGNGKGTNLEYSGIGEDIHRHMTEHETLQAVMRFGRDGDGATVYVHTNTLPEWVPIVDEGSVLRTRNGKEQSIIRALRDLCDEWRAGDVYRHPAVDCSDRHTRRVLAKLADEGWLDRTYEGGGYVYHDTGLDRINEHAEVELPAVVAPDISRIEASYGECPEFHWRELPRTEEERKARWKAMEAMAEDQPDRPRQEVEVDQYGEPPIYRDPTLG